MKHFLAIIVSGLLVGLASCSSEQSPDLAQGEGALRISAAADATVSDAVPSVRSSSATIVPDAGQLKISLSKQDGTYSKSWASLSDFPQSAPLKIGAYTASASWGTAEDEGFDKPYYYGETPVMIQEGEDVEAQIKATLANTMVSVAYTQAFKDYFSSYSSQLHSAGGDFITMLADETRPAYLRPGLVTLTLSLTKPNGVSATIQPAEFEALARHHYHLTLDVNNGLTGEAQLSVIFDDSIVSEDVTVDLSDDVLSAPAPVVTAAGFTPGTPVELMEQTRAPQPLTMTVSCAGGLRSATLTTQSQSLLAKGFPAEIDLMSATPAQQGVLTSCGLDVKGLWKNPDKMAAIDFAGVFEKISGTGSHSFALVVKDKLGKVNLPVIFEATTEGIELAITETPAVKLDATEASLTVSSNSPDLKDKVSVEVYTFGAWSKTELLSAAPSASSRHRAAGQTRNHTLRFRIPEGNTDVQARVLLSGTPRATTTINKRGALLTLESENHVFATSATFKVTHNPNVPINSLHYFIQPYNGAPTEATSLHFDSDNDRVTVKGLSPSTQYIVKAAEATTESSALNYATCNTEAVVQLPNSGMEDWCVTSSGKNWELRYPAKSEDVCVWGTNNPMTTRLHSNDYAYNAISGTKPVTGSDARTGTAACISTQGWGDSNTAIGTMSGVCRFIDPGLLHLGASRTDRPGGYGSSAREGVLTTDDLECGFPFASRPSALTFWYKYAAKNSADHGIVIAKVYDVLGREIASGQMEVSSQSAYTQATLPLTYAFGAPKAAKIYVCFQSTNVPDALKKDSNWMNAPRFGNLSRGEYYGSRLYIDDISLSY